VSGDACDFYHRYRYDIALLAAFGLQAFRFSIEWARIEPAEGEFSRIELDHYRRVLAACHEHRVVPVVTFHHFTLPLWVQQLGGLTSERFPELFERYCDRAAAHLGDLLTGYVSTINEPESLALGGYLWGMNPPGHKEDLEGIRRSTGFMLEAHRLGAAAIKAHAKAPVGITLALQEVQYEDGARPGHGPMELWAAISDRFLDAAREDDFVGVQTYTRTRIGPEGLRGPVGLEVAGGTEETEQSTQMGYEYYPQALGAMIRRAWRSAGGTPILITENGIATASDERRVTFVEAALREVLACLEDGIDARAYLYWALTDHFEWMYGYGPTFGLVEIDWRTFERRPRPSAYWLGRVARSRALPG
jgi:beta-glucosidase